MPWLWMQIARMKTRLLAVLSAATVLQGCASWRGDSRPIPQGGERLVPPPAETSEMKPAPIGENTVMRYGGELPPKQSEGTVTPTISFMEGAPPQAGPGVPWYVPYFPPPRSAAQPAHEPYSHAVERAVTGALIGGIVGAQFGSGSGRHVGAGIGAAAGTMIGLGASDNPCAAPHGGTIAGAALGGVLGNQIGSGSGRSAATALGAMLGALAGTQAGATTPGCR
jgi:hypothetical protein